MSQTYTLTLPYPPSVNNMWATVRGRRVLSKKGRLYRKDVALFCVASGLPRPLPTPIAVHVALYAPDNRHRDLDNIFKAVGDALQASGLLVNDADIDELHIVRKEIDRPAGHLVVTIIAG